MIPDPERDDPQPFTPGFAAVLTLGAAFLQFALLVIMGGMAGRVTPSIVGMATIGGFGSMFALGVLRLQEPPAQALGLVPAPSRAWLAALFLAPSILLVSELDNLLQVIIPLPDELKRGDTPEQGLALIEMAIVAIAVLPPIQELFFRGLLQPHAVAGLGRLRGIVVTATLSGLAALALGGPWHMQRNLTLGLLFGLLRECSGSLGPGLVLGVVFGAVTVLASYGVFGIPGFDDLEIAHTPLGWLLPAALATGVGLRLCQSLLAARSAEAEASDS